MGKSPFTPGSNWQNLTRALGLALVVAAWGPPAQSASPLSGAPDRATGFEEPLVATGPTSAEEDEALDRAVSSYRGQATDDGFQTFEAFLANHPHSGWRVAVLTNLGLSYYYYGYFSKSIDAFERAWKEGRPVTEPRAKTLVDRAVGELLKMHARLGHSEQLAALLAEIGERALTGPATELQAGAKEGLWMMRNDPGVAFLCGPMALKNLLLAKGVPAERLAYLDEYRSSPQGVTLAEVAGLADQAQLPYRLVRREVGASIPVPSVVHWKVSHFAAIVDESEGRYRIEDPTFGQALWVTRAAIDTEGSGYFLAPGDRHSAGWRDVGVDEASQIRGMGFTSSNKPGATTPQDDKTKGCSPRSGGMCGYDFTEMVVSLNLNDSPVGYAPPKGPPAYVTLTYNQREASQPANLSFFNVSPKWTLNWLSYVQDNPTLAGASVTRYVAGGGSVSYAGYNATTHAFKAEARDAALLVRTSAAPIEYERQLSDGSTEVYAQSDGATVSPRRIFLTQIIDPAGNGVTLNYDNRLRLTSLTDATGRSTTFAYGLSAQPLLVTQITDPFDRSATLTYDSMGRLSSITDVLGLTSSFSYDASSLVNAMTTPYGTTSFAYGETAGNQSRFVQGTDPLGLTERLEFRHQAPGISASDPASTVPEGMTTTNLFLNYRNTFYWDKRAYQVAAGDYTKARNKHWVHFGSATGDTVESLKNPLENRVWYFYPGQSGSNIAGSYDLPTRVGRVLDDGTTQLSKFAYNVFGRITQAVDPVGRTTLFAYAANQIDLATVTQTTASGPTIARFTYNNQHRPLSYADISAQVWSYAYNAAGQLTSETNPLGETTSFQ
jgi:YD repeat-containing protein